MAAARVRQKIEVFTAAGKVSVDAFRRVRIRLVSNTVVTVEQETAADPDAFEAVRDFTAEQIAAARDFARAHFSKLNGLGDTLLMLNIPGD